MCSIDEWTSGHALTVGEVTEDHLGHVANGGEHVDRVIQAKRRSHVLDSG
jgi:hypothetical protein